MGNTNIKIIGITGNTGSGKSFVSSYFGEFNIPVIDADHIAREVAIPGSPCLFELAAEFGQEIVSPQGALRRKYLGGIVFADPKKLERLNEISHKYILEEISRKLSAFEKQIAASRKDFPYPAVIIDAPLLIESRLNEICDVVIAVLADAELRAARISIRDNISLSDAMLRINAQKDNYFYAGHADFLLYNGGDKNEVFLQADLILNTIFENVSGV